MRGEEVNEAVEFPTRVLSVVAALASLAFAFVRQEILEDCIDLYHTTHLRSVHPANQCSLDN